MFKILKPIYIENFENSHHDMKQKKAIVNSLPPIYDQEPDMVAKDDEMSKDKEIEKLVALISLSFKKIHKPTNNNLRTSSNTSLAHQDNTLRINRGTGKGMQKVKWVKDAAYHKEKMLLCKQEEARVQLNAEQANWKDNTDDESDDQELEAHYMYMAQIQEVSLDTTENSRPIFDTEPLHEVHNNDDYYNVFTKNKEQHVQPESVNDTYLKEQGDTNITIDSLDMSTNEETVNQDDDDLANEHNLLASLIKKLKCKGKSVDTKFDRSSVVRQPNAQRIPKPSVLGKPTTFSNSLEKIYFPKTMSVPKANVSEGLSKPVTAQTLPQAAKKAVSNTNVLKPIMYRIDNKTSHTRAQQLPQTVSNTNPRVSTSTGVNHNTNVSRPQLKRNQSRDKVLPNNSQVKVKKTQVEVHPRIPSVSNKMKSVTACKDNLNSKTLNANIILFIIDSGCSKHITRNLKLLTNFMEKFLGIVKFGNDQIASILGYGDLVQGTIAVKWVYYVEGLNHNLFSVGQLCDADLEVSFWKSTCYIRDLKENDLLTGSRGTDMYSITLQDTSTPNLICLMAKATSSQAWLWHRRLSHLNFESVNLLSKNNIMIGLPNLKFIKDHLCSSCELEKPNESLFTQRLPRALKYGYNFYTWTYVVSCG
uniref:Retrovirus-related Pol polyprotein from transposon TNT 1-94 n=1 Tax=Tanacetum cinerariifolium TaxID=118510 RepID=A0A6L2P4Y7_TANCI|nr:retrovirus-related Pol polyprotein from transposon TNT 1-94 [Tanacetum cinerariifolium]